MRSAILVKDIIIHLCNSLECTQKTIASLTGINDSTISSNLEKNFADVITKKAGRRIASLAIVVTNFLELGLSKHAIMEIISIPVFPDLENNIDSVKSAIHNDKYEAGILVQISNHAYEIYKQKSHEKNEINKQVLEILNAS
jgi:hypothetical protein